MHDDLPQNALWITPILLVLVVLGIVLMCRSMYKMGKENSAMHQRCVDDCLPGVMVECDETPARTLCRQGERHYRPEAK